MSQEGVQVPPGEITRIGNWGVPLCKRDVQSFIGVLDFHWWQNPCMILWDRQLHSVGGTEQEKVC